MKKILLAMLVGLALFVLAGCGGTLRDGVYEYHRSTRPREEWCTMANTWMGMIERAGGVIVDGDRLASNGRTFYYFQITSDNVIQYRRRETNNWSSGPYRFRNGTIVLEFSDRHGDYQIWLRRTGGVPRD